MTARQRASRVLFASPVDAFYPVISLLAFLSGCCFGFYYAWRAGHTTHVVVIERREPDESKALADAA